MGIPSLRNARAPRNLKATQKYQKENRKARLKKNKNKLYHSSCWLSHLLSSWSIFCTQSTVGFRSLRRQNHSHGVLKMAATFSDWKISCSAELAGCNCLDMAARLQLQLISLCRRAAPHPHIPHSLRPRSWSWIISGVVYADWSTTLLCHTNTRALRFKRSWMYEIFLNNNLIYIG